MESPHFSNSTNGDQDDTNGTTETTGLLSSWIANLPLIRSRTATAATAPVNVDVNVNVNVNVDSTTTLGPATSSSGISVLVPENVASYGSINITDAGATTIPSSALRTVGNGNGSSVEEVVRRNSEPHGATHFGDIEDGEGGENRHHGQEQRRGGETDYATTTIAAANNDEEPSGETETTDDGEPARDGAIGNLTRRLRCMFSAITFPIVPLGTIVSMALLWVLYAATSLDLQKSCSHPLHSYALVSFLLVAYIPNHSQVRSQIFNYSRERDGPIRPVRVRMYDQFFHTVCLLYVYTGVTLIQTCRDDLVDKSAFAIAAASHANAHHNSYELAMDDGGGPWNSCEATCPNLYQAMSVYVATLELFTFALILPLLFLPCIYLWFLQRATADADAFSRLQDRLQEEDALLSNGGVTTGEILDSMEVVAIVARGGKSDNSNNSSSNKYNGNKNEELDESEQQQQQQQCWVLPVDAAPNARTGTKCDTKECCICMTTFDVRILPGDEVSSSSNPRDEALQHDHKVPDTDLGWKEIGHANSEKDDEGDGDDDEDSLQKELESVIVRTRCGHLFHKECLKSWVGEMWSASNNNSNNASYQTHQRDWRKRKARQIHCPLCREDLRPGDTSSDSHNRMDYFEVP